MSRSPAETSTPLGAGERSPATEELADHAPENSRADTAAADAEALGERLAAQQMLQHLLAEQTSLPRLLPIHPGWGAAQRRLRALAPEITRLQALAVRQAEAMSDPERAASALDAEVTEERGSPATQQSMRRGGDPTAGDLADPDHSTRRERLRQLQRELAHLKKTPSMQLLARQRIPRLEEAIKHLIAEVQPSA